MPADHIKQLSPAEHWVAEWQVAMEALILIAKTGGKTIPARLGLMRALNWHVEPACDPELKIPRWGNWKPRRSQ